MAKPRSRVPQTYFYFEEWWQAQHLMSPQTPEEEGSRIRLERFMHVAWKAGFQAGFEAKEQYDGSPLPHATQEPR